MSSMMNVADSDEERRNPKSDSWIYSRSPPAGQVRISHGIPIYGMHLFSWRWPKWIGEYPLLPCWQESGIPPTIARIRDRDSFRNHQYLQENFDVTWFTSPEAGHGKKKYGASSWRRRPYVGDFANGRVRLYEHGYSANLPIPHTRSKDLELPDENPCRHDFP